MAMAMASPGVQGPGPGQDLDGAGGPGPDFVGQVAPQRGDEDAVALAGGAFVGVGMAQAPSGVPADADSRGCRRPGSGASDPPTAGDARRSGGMPWNRAMGTGRHATGPEAQGAGRGTR